MGVRSKRLDPSQVPLKPRPGGNFWAGLLRVTRILIVLCVIGVLITLFIPVIDTLQKLQNSQQENEKKIAQEIQQHKQYQTEFELLRSNQEYIDRAARDTLNMGKPGETIFRFDPYKSDSDKLKLKPD